jgi:hypothetical protein
MLFLNILAFSANSECRRRYWFESSLVKAVWCKGSTSTSFCCFAAKPCLTHFSDFLTTRNHVMLSHFSDLMTVELLRSAILSHCSALYGLAKPLAVVFDSLFRTFDPGKQFRCRFLTLVSDFLARQNRFTTVFMPTNPIHFNFLTQSFSLMST